MPPFTELSAEQYRHMGLKVGLEIHQQLATKHKLFCKCPNTTYAPKYDAEVLRHMRPTMSEMGDYDGTALMEFKTKKEIVYRLKRETVCTYEMDDTPPFDLNAEALDTALEIAMLLNLKLVGELHIARKQYLDGSIPTGFQRTTIVGVDGSIPFKDKQIDIRQLGLEEDSCREVSDISHTRTFMTDRLCIPLVETVTEPQMHTPTEAAEVGEVLRRIARVTGKVRRGHGAARQDVNVSINGGTRVELKGICSLHRVPALVHFEALRQKNLLDIRAILRKRGLTAESFDAVTSDVTQVLGHSHFSPLREAVMSGGRVVAVKLPKFKGILGHPVGPGRPFAMEIAGRIRVIACLQGVPNLVYSDMAEPTIGTRLWNKLQSELEATERDAVVAVWGPKPDAELAAREIIVRAREAIEGVPSETRTDLGDGLTDFERILPGPSRMYPDTDLPPVAVTKERIEYIAEQRAEPPWEKHAFLTELGINDELADALILAGRGMLVKEIVGSMEIDPVFVATTLVSTFKAITRSWCAVEHLTDDRLRAFFSIFARGRFAREVGRDILEAMCQEGTRAVESIVDGLVGVPLDPTVLPKLVDDILGPHGDALDALCLQSATTMAMGLVMARVRGRIRGDVVHGIVSSYLHAKREVTK